MNINEKYPNKNILFLVKSEIRLKILNELNKKPQTINDIVKKTKMSYSSVSGNLNKLEYNNHVQKVDKIYELTPMTKLYLNQILEFKKSMDVIKNFNSLWEELLYFPNTYLIFCMLIIIDMCIVSACGVFSL